MVKVTKASKKSDSHPNMVAHKKFKTKIGLQNVETPMVGLKSGTAVPEQYYKDFIALTTNRDELIHNESVFYSFAEFQKTFGQWKKKYLHPMRVASSEVLRETNGTVNEQFQYRYVTFHCTHYGEPRIRGSGARPNQKYLPCGCRSMLRLAFDFKAGCLRVTTLNPIHMGHKISENIYRNVTRKCEQNVIRRLETTMTEEPPTPVVETEEVEQEEPSARDQMLTKYRNIQKSLAERLEQLHIERLALQDAEILQNFTILTPNTNNEENIFNNILHRLIPRKLGKEAFVKEFVSEYMLSPDFSRPNNKSDLDLLFKYIDNYWANRELQPTTSSQRQ